MRIQKCTGFLKRIFGGEFVEYDLATSEVATNDLATSELATNDLATSELATSE